MRMGKQRVGLVALVSPTENYAGGVREVRSKYREKERVKKQKLKHKQLNHEGQKKERTGPREGSRVIEKDRNKGNTGGNQSQSEHEEQPSVGRGNSSFYRREVKDEGK